VRENLCSNIKSLVRFYDKNEETLTVNNGQKFTKRKKGQTVKCDMSILVFFRIRVPLMAIIDVKILYAILYYNDEGTWVLINKTRLNDCSITI